MKKISKRILALALASAMIFSLAACGDDAEKNTNPTDATTETSGTASVDSDATYTYNVMMEAGPVNWNPHTWEMDVDDVVLSSFQTCMPLVDTSIAEDGSSYERVYEMATAVTDITATFADREKWGITEDAGRVWQIDLNENAKWEDGTPINADTYVYSMEKLLNSSMKNYRANTYMEGEIAVLNGGKYFNNDLAGKTRYASVFDGAEYVLGVDETDKMFVSLTAPTAFFGASLADAYAQYGAEMFTGADGTDYYQALAAVVGEEEFVPMNEDAKAALVGISSVLGGGYEEEFTEMAFYEDGVYEETPWEEVGLFKTGDYQIIYITEQPATEFYMLNGLSSNWIVNEELYEAGMTQSGDLWATNYGTAVDNFMSCGPYKIVSYEVDKQMILEKNDNWYGWTDGKHEGQYQTTDIKLDIVAEHNTALQLFNSGALDEVTLTADDMTTYRMSDYLVKTDQTFTYRWIFATDLDALTALEEQANDGANKKVLYYDDFRKAISLSMDRSRMVTEATSGYKPAYFLLNYLYYYDIENNPESQYRTADVAMKAVLDLYGIEYDDSNLEEKYNSVTGYDVEQAKQLFQSVYEQAIADGNYTDGQEVHIDCMVSAAASMGTEETAQEELMNEFVTKATEGTGFEGKIKFTFKTGAADRYADVAAGKVEMIRGAWGGAAFYPFSTIRVYCEPDYMGGVEMIHESNGWNPSVEKVEITYDFDGDGTPETKEDTFQNWAKSINGAGEYVSDPEASLAIVAGLETGILRAYQCIPWSTMTDVSLRSQQIEYGTYDYNLMYAYGGIRLQTYNYTDAEWEEYVASQGGTLSYE